MSNSGKKICLLGFLSGVGFAVAAGCSTRLSAGGTDSNTHWLDVCTRDDECGGLRCYCGRCTRACATEDSCAALGVNAQCGEPPSDCNVGHSVCVTSGHAPSKDAGAVPGLRDGGPGVPPPSRDSGRGVPVPSRESGTRGGRCAPMDARSNGTDCARTVGFTWNGVTCEPVLCGCAGTECGRIYPTAALCITDRDACNPAPPALCGQPLETGNCDGFSQRFGYSPAAAACVQFLYGLCGGNDNRFDTLEECNTACDGRADFCEVCPDGQCVAPTDAGPKPSCAACPKSRDSNGDPCTEKDLECMFFPACGAVTCVCAESSSGGLVWQCNANLC